MNLSTWQILILAVLQGTTEFLPVSSSGHLVIVAAAFAAGDGAAELDVSDVNIVLHGGTLLSILLFYCQRLRRLLHHDSRLAPLLAIATVPAVVVGLTIKLGDWDALLSSPLLAGAMLIVTGTVLLTTRRPAAALHSRHSPGSGDEPESARHVTVRQALLIGLSQAAAILPGLSRSGLTISTALRLGLPPRLAATFSFLMAIPVIAGACLLETVSMLGKSATLATSATNLILGAAVAFVVGLASLTVLVRVLERGRFSWFAYWCLPVGTGVVLWQLIR